MNRTPAATAQCWHVLGAGAIGTLLAFQLQRAGCEVVLLRRTVADCLRQPTLLDRQGYHRGSFPQQQVIADGCIDQLLVCTKAFSLAEALGSVRTRLHDASRVIVVANGLGFEPELAAAVPGVALLRAVCTEGAFRDPDAPDCIVHAGRGDTRVGEPGVDGDADRRRVPQWFSTGPGRASGWHWDARISEALWQKFSLNCAINALSAVHRCRNGRLLEDPERRQELHALCEEIALLSGALGRPQPLDRLWDAVCRVLRATANNHSSMLQDVIRGQQTEIAYLNGYLLDRADAMQIPIPTHRALLEQLQAQLRQR